jgi:hypothetical protein
MAEPETYIQTDALDSLVTFGLGIAEGGTGTPTFEVPRWARGVMLQAEDQDVRFVISSTDEAAAGYGMILKAGSDPILIEGKNLLQYMSFFEDAAGATLNIQFIGDR